MGVLGFLERRAADAVLPGSGVALGIMQRLKPAIPYIIGIIVALIVAFILWRAPWAEGRQKAADYAHFQPKIDRALVTIRTLKANQAKLLAALARQNAAVEALKATGDKRVSDGKAALAAAQRANAGLSEQAASLRKSAARKVDDTPCPISETLKNVGAI